MKVLDYLLIIGCIVSLVAGIFFAETSWPRDLLRFTLKAHGRETYSASLLFSA